MGILGKTATAFVGYKGVKGGLKAAAAIAAGRWIYNQWQSHQSTKSSSNAM
jgi:hypothetical protein